MKSGATAHRLDRKNEPVVLNSEPGVIVGQTGCGDGALVARWLIESGDVMLYWNESPCGEATWRNHRFVSAGGIGGGPMVVVGVAQAFLQNAITEIELAFVRAERDDAVLIGAATHPTALVRSGVRPAIWMDDGTRGEIGRALGDENEHQGLGAVRKALADEGWFVKARRATAEEDRGGIDLVAETADAGELYVQVKSSEGGARTWRRRYAGTAIGPRTAMLILRGPPSELHLAKLRGDLRRLYRNAGGALPFGEPKPVGTPQISPERQRREALAVGDIKGAGLKGQPAKTVRLMVEAQSVAAERERLKTERMRIAAEERDQARALRWLLRELPALPGGDALVARVLEHWPSLTPLQQCKPP